MIRSGILFCNYSGVQINPVFLRISVPIVGIQKGYLLGTHHALAINDLSFDNAREIYSQDSKIKQIFDRSSQFVTEINGLEYRDEAFIRKMMKEKQSIDMAFLLEAKEKNKQIIGLETIEESSKRAIQLTDEEVSDYLSSIPPEQFEQETAQLLLEKGEDAGEKYKHLQTRHLIAGTYEEFFKIKVLRAIERFNLKLHKETNEKWADKINSILKKSSGETFVAMGMAHLPGEGGVVEGLRKRGWEVTRV